MSETTGPATSNLPGAEKIGSVGRALPGVEVVLADDGEILMRGGVITAGYYRAPEETAEAFDRKAGCTRAIWVASMTMASSSSSDGRRRSSSMRPARTSPRPSWKRR